MKAINFNPADFEPVRELALKFPNASDSVSHYDTPSVKIKKHLLCRLHENGEWLSVRTDFHTREIFLEKYPESCFINEHYKNYPYIAVYIDNYTTDMLMALLKSGYKAITEKDK